jgi:hypothetical protein
MNAFFVIAGIVITLLGVLAVCVIAAVWLWVYVLQNELNLRYEPDKRKRKDGTEL